MEYTQDIVIGKEDVETNFENVITLPGNERYISTPGNIVIKGNMGDIVVTKVLQAGKSINILPGTRVRAYAMYAGEDILSAEILHVSKIIAGRDIRAKEIIGNEIVAGSSIVMMDGIGNFDIRRVVAGKEILTNGAIIAKELMAPEIRASKITMSVHLPLCANVVITKEKCPVPVSSYEDKLKATKRDLFRVLKDISNDIIEGLREAIVNGRIDGATYYGKCACLIGT